ncbi:kelch repeat protein [Parathielavia hyrcaniae]|uniref:Kelch repeat protein n=1 Tax=Parathielavia hyrcaniae TaxID=113614 RepID=A0AAN6T0J8_9PEZI|nr:kelch repeat protein [Parathielavia hyrcaniae]
MASLPARWTRLASSERLARSSQSLSALGSQAWIFGGELLPRQPVDNRLDLVQLSSSQDPTTTTLYAPTPAPTPRVGAATTTLNGALYLFSGRGGLAMAPIEENGALWRYDPTQSAWTLLEPADPSAPYPAGRSYHAMASDGTDTLYLHAGCPEKGRLADLWSFSVAPRTWTELPAAPAPARGGPSTAICRGRLYRMNGFDGQTEQGGAVDVFDLAARAWSTIAFKPDGVQGPEARSVSALLAVRVGGRDWLVTLFGERDPSSLGHAGAGKMLGDVWAFDLEQGKWAKVEVGGDAPAPRGWFGADVATEGEGGHAVIVHGGLAEDNSRLGDVWKLDFE